MSTGRILTIDRESSLLNCSSAAAGTCVCCVCFLCLPIEQLAVAWFSSSFLTSPNGKKRNMAGGLSLSYPLLLRGFPHPSFVVGRFSSPFLTIQMVA
ncbi:unnamed protein product [Sphagnum troendelagicum]